MAVPQPRGRSGPQPAGAGPVSAVIVEDLVKRYGEFTAVEQVSFTAPSGQVTAVLGP